MEYNIIHKKIKPGIVRVAYVYPSLYEVMATSLVSHIIYFLVNESFPEVYMERFHSASLYGEEPPARSLETNSPLRDFNLIITSLHYEPNIANLVKLLYYSGIDPRRKTRRHIIIAGGPAIMANPHPYNSIIDAFIIGEAENTIPRIINTYLEYSDNKKIFLDELAKYRDIYVPEYTSGKVYRSYVENLDEAFYPIKQFQHIEKEPIYGKGLLVETSRGCRFWCRFCIEGRLFKPYRVRSFNRLKKIIEKGLDINKLNRVIFFSLTFLSSSSEKRVLEYLVDNDIKASIPSIRFETLSDDNIELLKHIGQKTLTLAPESFSNYVQLIFGKYGCIDDLIYRINTLLEEGFDLKLYIISGFKGENINDIKRNIMILRSIAENAKRYGRRVSISINPLIPKPKTVFQWIGMIDLDKAKKIINLYRRELSNLVDTRPYYVNWGFVQAAIALAGPEISDILIEWGIRGGSLGAWRRIIREKGFNTEYVFKGYSIDEELPWNNIVIGERVEELNKIEYMVLEKLLFKR